MPEASDFARRLTVAATVVLTAVPLASGCGARLTPEQRTAGLESGGFTSTTATEPRP